MAKKTKETKFFPGSRREFRLDSYQLLDNGDKRNKLQVEMPITGKSVVGMPDWVSDPYTEMGKNTSKTGRLNIEVMCEGMTMDIYSTEKIRKRAHSSTGVRITNFALVATGEGEDREVSLHAVIYMPGNIEIHQWAWDHIHMTFFADFEYSQTEMDFDGEDEEEGEELEASGADDDEDEEEIGGNENFNPREIRAAAGKR